MAKAYLEATEIRELEQVANYMRDRLMIRLLFHFGCRISEALALELKDIDFKKGTVLLQLAEFLKSTAVSAQSEPEK